MDDLSPLLPPPAFFPSSDAGDDWFSTGQANRVLPERPHDVGPVFDPRSSEEPLPPFDPAIFDQQYAQPHPGDISAHAPSVPDTFHDPYLYPMLTRNERVRLTMLWYYTRELFVNTDLLNRVQEKVDLVCRWIGWDLAICGLVDNHVYHRLVTSGLPLAILPRRESTCAHTIQQTPGTVFHIPDMSQDWRFKNSPHVEKGGLRSYAGTQLRCRAGDREEVALGTLCIASNTPNLPLTAMQADTLVRFAAMLTEEIINQARMRRRRQQQRMNELISLASSQQDVDKTETFVMNMLHEVYPTAQVSVQDVPNNHIILDQATVVPLSDIRQGLWEDAAHLDSILRSGNHQQLESQTFVRAIIGRFWAHPTVKVLVVTTKEITLVFDDIDSWFVERCSAILNNVAKERSLQEALTAKDKFLRGITHQLRTPIHGVLGSVDLLTEEMSHGLSGKSRHLDTAEILRTIKNSGRELMSTVNNMIKLNRWAEVTGSPRQALLSELNHLEEGIVDETTQLMPEEDANRLVIFFDNRLTTETSIVTIDMGLLKDCLQSLVLNALQNTTQGSVIITISAAEDFSALIFDVEDTGCGIPLPDQSRIFSAYEKSNIHTKGAGLGLTLACKLAEAMNGSVTLVSSTPGEGSHFRATFNYPGFACPPVRPPPRDPRLGYLPDTFHIVPSDPPAPIMHHFVNFLRTRGLRESEDSKGALVIVSFTADADQFEKLLGSAINVRLAISLVPAMENSAHVQERHPEVLFFTGPYTTNRLDEILALANESCSKIPEKSDAENKNISSTEHADLLTSSVNHRRTGTSSSTFKRTRSRSAPRCLLVDDNLINLRIVRMYCEKRALKYQTAVDGIEAVDKYREAADEAPVSLILLDLQMPRCDGIQACKDIRAFEGERNLAPAIIFIVTGQDSPSDRENSLQAGADEFFVKPMGLKSLDRGVGLYFEGFG